MIDDKALIAKADAGEGLTVEEIKRYQHLVKPQHHVYGKYGTLALRYMEEHNVDSRVLIAWTSPPKAAFARLTAHPHCNTAESIAASSSRQFIAKYALWGCVAI